MMNLMTAMVSEGMSCVSGKRGESDQCGRCQLFEMKLSIPYRCYDINLK